MCDADLHVMYPFDVGYTAMASLGSYFVAMRSSNRIFERPLPPPTTLEVWRATQKSPRPEDIPAPAGRLELVRTLDVAGWWGFSLHLSEGEQGPVLGVLGTAPVLTSRTEDVHWLASRGMREVRIWYLEDQMREARHVVPLPEASPWVKVSRSRPSMFRSLSPS
jgi:hypothetical protein